MENALFYTFSTIAQTLAAAIGFLGAFALYRFQSTRAILTEYSNYIIHETFENEETKALVREEKFEELQKYIRSSRSKDNPQVYPNFESNMQTFDTNLKSMLSMRYKLKQALTLTIIVIVISIAILIFTPTIACSFLAIKIIFTLGFILLVWCLILDAIFVLQALK
jgi:uncharacterized membrane protein